MVSAVRELDELAGLDSEWRELAERRGNAFVTPEWFRCWFEHYGTDATPLVPTVRDAAGRLKGLLPLALSRSGRPRTCRIAGANLGDRFHPVCEPGDEPEVGAAAGTMLGSTDEPWSVLALDHVEVERSWVPALEEATGRRLHALERTAGELPLVDLSNHASWDEYLATRSSNFRQQVRRFTRRAAKERSMRLRRTESAAELGDDLTTFFDLHDRRQAAHGGSSLEADRARAFHADFAAACLDRGWLRLWFLEFDGRPVATLYAWRLGDRYSYYNSGFDPDESKLSPGLVLLSAVIEAALDEGAAVFDFLLGDERYKFRFAERSETVSDIALTRALPHPAAVVTGTEHAMRRVGRMLPESARDRLAGLARRSLLRGRGR
jgi:CelD/BcsL family acetyltransferase involved in cellulose biosynthesis